MSEALIFGGIFGYFTLAFLVAWAVQRYLKKRRHEKTWDEIFDENRDGWPS
ncbi:hypothetical protein GGE68_001385 [Rhizobium leguminosarum]|uniref:hypothetical protein n=1 Tax=Rhizobium leguminosarum TaxID=384 RepID=UPI0016218158|nr:hypothetical protein [Rhizobium leguminosarum]MBB5663209.1 hypothetical protein [Rhizobium leguminosarum]